MSMLDLKFVRENLDKVAEAMKNRHTEVDLDAFRKLDQERRDLLRLVRAHAASISAGRCPSCGYDTSAVDGPCPECGKHRDEVKDGLL